MSYRHFLPFLLYGLSLAPAGAQDSSSLIFKVDGTESAYPRLSADGKRILFQSNKTGHWQLYILRLSDGAVRPVMQDSFNNNFPDWSHDNTWIAFTSDRDGNEEIYLMREDGSQLRRLTNHFGRDIHPYFSPDGRYLLFNSTRINGSFDIFRYTLATGELKTLSQTHEDETCARFSPDMRHLLYLQNGATTDDVFLADSLNTSKMNISNTPDIRDGWPVFSWDNQWIIYSSLEQGKFSLYRVRTDGRDKIQITHAGAGEEDARAYPSRDGRRLVFNRRKGNTIEIREIRLG